jgi:hypothetical protein
VSYVCTPPQSACQRDRWELLLPLMAAPQLSDSVVTTIYVPPYVVVKTVTP